MKIELRKHVMSHYTFNSPYPHENGEHITESILAHCGNCGRSIEEAHFYHSWNFCPYCGEKIDWPEDEDDHRS